MAAKTAQPAPTRGASTTIGFGLVNVPVKFKPLHDTVNPVSGSTICSDHQEQVKMRWICGAGTDHEHYLLPGETCRAYEHDGQFIVLDDAVLEEFVADRTGRVEITAIVPDTDLDPAVVDKTYLAWPDDGAGEAFDLLTAVLREDKVAAIGTTVLAKQTVMFALRWSASVGTVVAHTLRFDSRLRKFDVDLTKAGRDARTAPSDEALALARQMFVGLAGRLDTSEVDDEYFPALQDAIVAAAAGKKPKAKPKAKPEAAATDLVAALKASVAAAEKPKSRKKVTA
jgi:DNA end-binding protein Ku